MAPSFAFTSERHRLAGTGAELPPKWTASRARTWTAVPAEGQDIRAAFVVLKKGRAAYIAVSGGSPFRSSSAVARLTRSAPWAGFSSGGAAGQCDALVVGAAKRPARRQGCAGSVAPVVPGAFPSFACLPASTGTHNGGNRAGISSRIPGRWAPESTASVTGFRGGAAARAVERSSPSGAAPIQATSSTAAIPMARSKADGIDPIVLHRDAVLRRRHFHARDRDLLGGDMDFIGQIIRTRRPSL